MLSCSRQAFPHQHHQATRYTKWTETWNYQIITKDTTTASIATTTNGLITKDTASIATTTNDAKTRCTRCTVQCLTIPLGASCPNLHQRSSAPGVQLSLTTEMWVVNEVIVVAAFDVDVDVDVDADIDVDVNAPPSVKLSLETE